MIIESDDLRSVYNVFLVVYPTPLQKEIATTMGIAYSTLIGFKTGTGGLSRPKRIELVNYMVKRDAEFVISLFNQLNIDITPSVTIPAKEIELIIPL